MCCKCCKLVNVAFVVHSSVDLFAYKSMGAISTGPHLAFVGPFGGLPMDGSDSVLQCRGTVHGSETQRLLLQSTEKPVELLKLGFTGSSCSALQWWTMMNSDGVGTGGSPPKEAHTSTSSEYITLFCCQPAAVFFSHTKVASAISQLAVNQQYFFLTVNLALATGDNQPNRAYISLWGWKDVEL